MHGVSSSVAKHQFFSPPPLHPVRSSGAATGAVRFNPAAFLLFFFFYRVVFLLSEVGAFAKFFFLRCAFLLLNVPVLFLLVEAIQIYDNFLYSLTCMYIGMEMELDWTEPDMPLLIIVMLFFFCDSGVLFLLWRDGGNLRAKAFLFPFALY